MKKSFLWERVIPGYAVVPLVSALLINCAVYFGTKPIALLGTMHSLALPIESAIPFCPAFILFYVLAYLQWCVGYLYAARRSREICNRIAAADIVAKLLCGIAFCVFPTAIDRPIPSGTGVTAWLTRWIFSMDIPINLFPSIHCLESWMVFRASLMIKGTSNVYRVSQLLFSLFVFASTVFLKQHYLLDIAGGIAVAEIGLLIVKLTNLQRIFDKTEIRPRGSVPPTA